MAISHKVSIIPFDHNLSLHSGTIKDSGPIGSPIKIDSDCWLGAGSILLEELSALVVLSSPQAQFLGNEQGLTLYTQEYQRSLRKYIMK